jgi:Uncharacterized ACR, COG1678
MAPSCLGGPVRGSLTAVHAHPAVDVHGSGQLENELDQGSWLTAPATAEHVFCDEETAWEKITRHILGRQMIDTLNIKHVPKDPGMN